MVLIAQQAIPYNVDKGNYLGNQRNKCDFLLPSPLVVTHIPVFQLVCQSIASMYCVTWIYLSSHIARLPERLLD
jgi:hypothetical protein